MKTTLSRMMLVAAVCLLGLVARAQTNPPPVNSGGTKITLDKMAATTSNPLGVDTNIVSQISLDSEMALGTVLQYLADNAKLKIRFAPELAPNGRPGPLLSAPVGNARFEQMSHFEALTRLVRKNDLVMGTYANSPDIIIGTRESKLTPISEPTGEIGAEGDFESNLGATDEIPLQTAIIMLAKFAKLPIILDPKLKTGGERIIGTNLVNIPSITNVTVNLSSMGDLTARQRLQAILDNHELQMVQDPNSGVYKVTYKEPGAREPLVPNVYVLKYSNVTNIQDLLTTTFPAPTKIRADTRTASLLVVSTAKDWNTITNLITQLDTPTKQVLIEARFLETLANPKTVKGIDWTDTLGANRITFGNGTRGGDPAAQTPFTINSTTTSSTTTPVNTPNGRPAGSVTATTAGSAGGTVTTLDPNAPGFTLNTANGFSPSTAFLNSQGVSAVLSFLNTEADVRTLATPRAVTLDNQETKLEVTRAIPIFDASEGIGQGGTAVSSSKPNYTNVGTILFVKPHISGTNILMSVKPEISKVEATPSRKVIAGKVNEADIFATSKIETQVIIPSGNTLVMGGLISDSTFRNYTKVPFLGDIPILGWAFRHESHEQSKANLIIFVTPTIVDEDDYQPYRTKFLNEKMPEHPKIDDRPIKSGKAAQYGKNKTKTDPNVTESGQ